MEPAEFLNTVWNAGMDEQMVLDAVQKKALIVSGDKGVRHD